MPQRGLAWQLGSQTVRTILASGIELRSELHARGISPPGTCASNAFKVIAACAQNPTALLGAEFALIRLG
jgi:hypothetical protein